MPIPPEANVRLKVEADITKRSKPVRYAKAPLTRFGSVLRGTVRPYELHSWQLHCKTLPYAPGAPVRDLRPFRAPATPVLMRGVSEGRNAVPVRRTVPESGQPAAGLSPPGAAGAFPPNKGKAVARLSTAPRSGCLPLPLPSHTRSRQETRPGIPPGPPKKSVGQAWGKNKKENRQVRDFTQLSDFPR